MMDNCKNYPSPHNAPGFKMLQQLKNHFRALPPHIDAKGQITIGTVILARVDLESSHTTTILFIKAHTGSSNSSVSGIFVLATDRGIEFAVKIVARTPWHRL
ncbi:hypothetical protein PYW07_000362 [Mythimna separata]|uniref:Uncharacterized protein n=1 Tax=Mythimna separata TaxID=271217 RepID=A0AAD7Z4E5_MYTSE|nr:hypothetical protein PYW07_000362 [Mythimna separata]